MNFLEILPGSVAYKQEMELRHQVLRKPLGLVYTAEDLALEANDRHFGLFEGDRLLACLLMRDRGEGLTQIRQVAVDPVEQGKGVGAALMAFAERTLLHEKPGAPHEVLLHAREVVVPFYEKLGYKRVGPKYVEVGIPHYDMKKKLSRESS